MTVDDYIVRYYPLVTHRFVSLSFMAKKLGLTGPALRSRAYRLGATGDPSKRLHSDGLDLVRLMRRMQKGTDRHFRMDLYSR